MTKDLFTKAIVALQKQYDMDNKRASELSTIYGADIDPNNNYYLMNAIFGFLHERFPPKNDVCEIQVFCFDQDFGRAVNRTIDGLWYELLLQEKIMNMDVKGYEIISGTE